jgi:hypothetical protein
VAVEHPLDLQRVRRGRGGVLVHGTHSSRGAAEAIPFGGIQKCHALICFQASAYSLWDN